MTTTDWKNRYTLRSVGDGEFVYEFKGPADDSHGEVAHWICPACFAVDVRSLLTKVEYTFERGWQCSRAMGPKQPCSFLVGAENDQPRFAVQD